MVINGGVKAVGALLLTSVVLVAATVWRRKSRAERRGEIAKLFIYPIKSCRGISVWTAKCTPLGLQHGILRDRSFMIVDKEAGKFISLAENPSVVLIEPSVRPDDGKSIWLNAPSMETLHIDVEELDRIKGKLVEITRRGITLRGYDCGDKHADWFQTFLKKPNLRLVYQGLDLPPSRGDQIDGFGKFMKKTDLIPYNFTSAFSLNSESSHKDMNTRLANPMPIASFRPNITVSGTDPYEEDKWDVVRLGDEAILQVRKLCQRCIYVNVNSEDGNNNPEVLKTLLKYRKCWDASLNKIKGHATPIMGVNVGLEREGTLRVGDPVHVSYK